MMGLAPGVAAATGMTRYLQSMLFDVTPLDSVAFIATSLVFALIATVAALVPAHRATRVDPLVALKAE
jgi:ABC-type antimicrobial peptide transport system permease subunit